VGVWMLSTGLASLQPPQLASRHVTHALTAAVESARCDGVAHRCHPANRQQEALATKQARMHAGTHAHSPTTIATMQHMRFPHCEHAQRCSGPGCCPGPRHVVLLGAAPRRGRARGVQTIQVPEQAEVSGAAAEQLPAARCTMPHGMKTRACKGTRMSRAPAANASVPRMSARHAGRSPLR
jgi:hypothetical protein